MAGQSPLEAERSPSSQGSVVSEGRRSGGLSFRRRSSRSGRSSRDGTSDLDDWGKSPRDRAEALGQFDAALRAVPENRDYPPFDKWTLLRFLRARDYDIKKSTEMYTNHLRWRKENGVDTILTDFEFTEREAFLGVYPQGYYKIDKAGRPVTIQHLGSIDLKKIKEVTTVDRMIRYHIQEYERFLKHITPVCSRVSGRHIDQTFAILDVKGVTLKMVTGEVRKMLADITKIDNDHYPETLGKTCIINVPYFFKVIWGFVKPMLPPRTVAKISLVGTKYMDELLKYIDIENIPEYLGGKSKNPLIDDAGPWNDPIVLSSLNKITEDSFDEPATALEGGFGRHDSDAGARSTIGAEPPATEPAAAPKAAPAADAQRSPQRSFPAPDATARAVTAPLPNGGNTLIDRVRALELALRDAGASVAEVPAPASGAILARVEFLERAMSVVLQSQKDALAQAAAETSRSEQKLRDVTRELNTLRARQEQAGSGPRGGCCTIM